VARDRAGRRRIRNGNSRIRTLVLILLLGVAAAAFVALKFAGSALVISEDIPAPEAIIVLGSHEWERLPAAAWMARRHRSASLLLTVPRVVTQMNCYDCEERAEWLVEAGVAPNRIVELDQRVTRTLDEAEAALAYSSSNGIRRLLVVTSPYHARRSLATFRHVFTDSGIEIGIHPALAESNAVPDRWWLRRYDRRYVVYEWAGIAMYFVRFGVWPFV
jgi:uncharacterized SAM-binding protein YcdF (DUF218 family)